MYSKIFISTKTFGSLLLCFLFSCNNPDTTNRRDGNPAEADTQKALQLQQEKEKPVPQTNKTVEGFLMDFGRKNPETKAVIITPKGEIVIHLFENTPLHRANFVYLAKQGYFDGTWFYRVSAGHVIQAGDNDEPETVKKREKLGDYSIPAEFNKGHYHLKGAVAAARNYKNNPAKRSMPFEFYINLGRKYNRAELKALEGKYNIKLSPGQIDAYSASAGSPHLDGEHTVFGEVISGMEVVEEISRVEVDEGEWPLMNIPITVRVE